MLDMADWCLNKDQGKKKIVDTGTLLTMHAKGGKCTDSININLQRYTDINIIRYKTLEKRKMGPFGLKRKMGSLGQREKWAHRKQNRERCTDFIRH